MDHKSDEASKEKKSDAASLEEFKEDQRKEDQKLQQFSQLWAPADKEKPPT